MVRSQGNLILEVNIKVDENNITFVQEPEIYVRKNGTNG